MKLKFWLDIYPWSTKESLFVTTTPSMPKSSDGKRFMIEAEIPEIDWDADKTITAIVKEEE